MDNGQINNNGQMNNQINNSDQMNNQINSNDQMNGQSVNINNNDEKRGRGLFYSVIAVAVFIVMAVGATFAYFTATTNSGERAVQTGSTSLQLKYISYETAWMRNDLIPADSDVVEYSFEYQDNSTVTNPTDLNNTLCKDDYGNSICSVYVFQVYNGANSPQNVNISLVSEDNTFYNLYAMGYEIGIPTEQEKLDIYNGYDSQDISVSLDPKLRKSAEDAETVGIINVVDNNSQVLDFRNDGEDMVTAASNNRYYPVYINRVGVVKKLLKYKNGENSLVPAVDVHVVTVNEPKGLIPEQAVENLGKENVAARTSLIGSDIEIGGGEIKSFAIVLYIKNLESDQTIYDADKKFSGNVFVGSGDGTVGVSGSIGSLQSGDLQSHQGSSSSTEPSTGG